MNNSIDQRYADLHIHTTCSDGEFTPTGIIQLAKTSAVSAVAITDHFTVAGIQEATEEGKRQGIEVIPGIELVAEYNQIRFHLIGLMLDECSQKLREMLKLYHSKRMKYVMRFLYELQVNGYSFPMDLKVDYFHISDLISYYKSTLPVKQYRKAIDGIVRSEYYQKITQLPIPFEEICSVIHESGGIVIIPHMSTLKISDQKLESFLVLLKKQSLDGIETWHPYYDSKQIQCYKYLAEKLDLLKSGGSDFHGEVKSAFKLGQCTVSKNVLNTMKEYRTNQIRKRWIGENHTYGREN